MDNEGANSQCEFERIMKSDNLISEKSIEFAIRIVNLYKYLCKEKEEYVMSKQLLRSGTSVGANVREGVYGQSRNDFVSKMSIGLKEAAETEYWLELLYRTGYLSEKEYGDIQTDCKEIVKILTSIVKSSR